MHTKRSEKEEIEIVARALCKIDYLDGGDQDDDGFDDCPEPLKGKLLKIAKDAIAAKRSW